ncbi:MAG: PGDYG domain-containing protein [Pseudomonadota bacterium]
MFELKNIDLRSDPDSGQYIKSETVHVAFATSDGELISREGPNRYAVGDALITGSTGNQWSVSRDRFDAKYEPVQPLTLGEEGAYRNKPIPVLAKQMHEAFKIARSSGGDMLAGNAEDWLMQYAPDDFGIVENPRFQQVYKLFKK